MNAQTAEWVRKAEADLAAAVRLFGTRPRLHDLVCSHCQQGSEKYIKALLQETGRPVPRSHDLQSLLAPLAAQDLLLGALDSSASSLTQFAVAYRYPGNRVVLPEMI